MVTIKKITALLCGLLSVALLLCAFNVVTDPVGVFGDKLLNWYSYNMTNNPRVAKIAYLEKNHHKYDSYIIGCSSTSSFPTEDFNKYLGANFYNLIMYGADMQDTQLTVDYIIDNYKVKNLVLNVFLSNGDTYATQDSDVLYNLHHKVSGENPLWFYSKYLFLNPAYGASKLKSLAKDTYLQQSFDVFDENTGAYDKKKRDAEPISDLHSYLEVYNEFVNYANYNIGLSNTDKCMESVKLIKQKCDKNGVNLIVVSAPVYTDHFACFNEYLAYDFYYKLAQITDYWDFSMSSVSCEPRFFYDKTHFRNCVGKMAAARIFNDTSVYIPDDFGVYVTKENVEAHLVGFKNVQNATQSTTLPILMYHNLSNNGGDDSISAEKFEQHISTLYELGYNSVSFSQLCDYVQKGIDLPEKPVVITFDDGYLSNYEIAYPILKKYNTKATMFVIGVSVGSREYYKDTNHSITPHFSYEQAREMEQSGLVDIQSHTYDMHMWAPYEKQQTEVRPNILRTKDESDKSYLEALERDLEKTNADFEKHLSKKATVLSYPGGYTDPMAQAVLMQNGICATVSTKEGKATVVKGLPQSLIMMNRFNINGTTTMEKFLKKIS